MKSIPFALPVIFCVVLAGCGTTGATKSFVLPIDPTIVEGIERNIHAGGIVVADDANIVIAAGTNPWGVFGESDRSNLEQSLEQTLRVLDKYSTDLSLPAWTVEVLLRRHVIAHDNNSAGLLVCVAWALKSEAGDVVYENQFYGADSVALVGTIGGLKNSVNKAVVQRIVESAVRLASSKSIDGVSVRNTYDTLDEAASTLPERYRSLPVVIYSNSRASILGADLSTGGISVVQPNDAAVKTVDWQTLEPTDPVTWE